MYLSPVIVIVIVIVIVKVTVIVIVIVIVIAIAIAIAIAIVTPRASPARNAPGGQVRPREAGAEGAGGADAGIQGRPSDTYIHTYICMCIYAYT